MTARYISLWWPQLLSALVFATVGFPNLARADEFEADLLKRFVTENLTTAKKEVEEALARVKRLAGTQHDEAVRVLKDAIFKLQLESALPPEARSNLRQVLEVHLKELSAAGVQAVFLFDNDREVPGTLIEVDQEGVTLKLRGRTYTDRPYHDIYAPHKVVGIQIARGFYFYNALQKQHLFVSNETHFAMMEEARRQEREAMAQVKREHEALQALQYQAWLTAQHNPPVSSPNSGEMSNAAKLIWTGVGLVGLYKLGKHMNFWGSSENSTAGGGRGGASSPSALLNVGPGLTTPAKTTISGFVTNRFGKPHANARLVFRDVNILTTFSNRSEQVTTDKAGRFQLHQLTVVTEVSFPELAPFGRLLQLPRRHSHDDGILYIAAPK